MCSNSVTITKLMSPSWNNDFIDLDMLRMSARVLLHHAPIVGNGTDLKSGLMVSLSHATVYERKLYGTGPALLFC